MNPKFNKAAGIDSIHPLPDDRFSRKNSYFFWLQHFHQKFLTLD